MAMDKRRVLFAFLLILGIISLLVGIIGLKTSGTWWFIILIVIGGICLALIIWLFVIENLKKR